MTRRRPHHQLVEQLDWHWTHALRPRLDGLTDDEYFWAAGAGLLDRASRRRHRLRLSRRLSRRRSRRSRGGWRTSSSACSRCATTRTSAARLPTTRPGPTPPTPRRRCVNSTTRTDIGSTACAGCPTMTWPAGRAGRRSVRRRSDDRPGAAHQPRGHPPRRRNRLHPRSLRPHQTRRRTEPCPQCPHPSPTSAQALRDYIAFTAPRLPRPRLRAHRRAGARHADGQRTVDRRTDQTRHRCQQGWMQRVAAAPEHPPSGRAADRGTSGRVRRRVRDERGRDPGATCSTRFENRTPRRCD